MKHLFIITSKIALAIMGSLIILGFTGCGPMEAKPAPAWELNSVEGKTIKSSDFAGKVMILDFWATWCPPCRQEIPGFISLQKKYGADGLVVVGVAMDQEGVQVVKPFQQKMGINYPLVIGDEKIIQDFGGIVGLPTTFIIDRQGMIVGKHVGYTSEAEFEKNITPLLPTP